MSEAGQLIWDAEKDDWRAVKKQRAIPGITQPIRFQGQWEDEETGLYYNRHRYYDPDMGRYITQDPIGLQGGLNGYEYVASPTGWVDPLGLSGDCISFKADPRTGKKVTCLQTPAQVCAASGSHMTMHNGVCMHNDIAAKQAGKLNPSTATHDNSEAGVNLCATVGALAGKGDLPLEIDIADKMGTTFDRLYHFINSENVPYVDKIQKITTFSTRFKSLQDPCRVMAGKQSWQLQNWD